MLARSRACCYRSWNGGAFMEVSTEQKMATVLDSLRDCDFSNPRGSDGRPRDCDVVMKGGITSGVVYPLAVLELAKSHRFHSIGGTSAGAIAAVVTAAAEYGRQCRGFNRLVKTVEDLQQPGFIANVFQPSPELRP